jgi:hypothetical protein
MPAAEYQGLLKTRAPRLLSEGTPASYPRSLAGAIQLTMERLIARNPAAAALAETCAFFAPEPIPLALFPAAASQLPDPLAQAASDPIAWRNALAGLNRTTVARVDRQSLQLHRLTQSILRNQLPADRASETRDLAATILVTNQPPDPDDPANWPAWANLLPHILASDPADSDRADLRDLACRAARYLLMHADTQAAHDLTTSLHQAWQQHLGPDHPQTLTAASHLAHALADLGQFDHAKELDEDTLIRCRRVLGDDHPDSLRSATGLAADLTHLGNYQGARELHEDTLNRRRRVLGDDHPETLQSANNLAGSLVQLGDHQAARQLYEDAFMRCRRVLGDDHPDTLLTANNLAVNLFQLGDHQAARQLNEDTLNRRRRVLGDDHPETLQSANDVANDLHALGDHHAARQLHEDTLNRHRRTVGDDHPETLQSAYDLANDLHALGDHHAARQLHEDTLNRYRRILGDDHPDTLRSATGLAARLRALDEGGS